MFLRSGNSNFSSMCLSASLALLSACTPAAESVSGLEMSEDSNQIFQEQNIRKFDLEPGVVALTIDDGPTPQVTEPLLTYLRQEGVRATFFVVGINVPGQESTMRRMKADGHVIANHSYTHPGLKGMLKKGGPDALFKEMRASHNAIAPFLTDDSRLYFRAPGGMWTPRHAEILNADPQLRKYVGPIYWNVGGYLARGANGEISKAADWDCWHQKVSIQQCAEGYLKAIEENRGGVVLLHDKFVQSVGLIKALVPELKKRGYRFVTLDEVRSLDKYAN